MSINPFLLDNSFNVLLERGKGHDERRRAAGKGLPAPKVVKQGDAAKPAGRGTVQGDNPQADYSGARSSVLTGLAALSMAKDMSAQAATKAARGEKISRTALAKEFGRTASPASGTVLPPHGTEASPMHKTYLVGAQRGRAQTGIQPGVMAPPEDDGTSLGVMRTKSGELVKGTTRQTDPDVPSISTTSSGTGDVGGRAGKETHGRGNPGGEALLNRQEREAELAAKGKHPVDSQKAGNPHKKGQRVPHLVDNLGRSIGGYTRSKTPGSTSPVPPGLPKRTGKAAHGTSARPLPNSGGDNPTDNAIKAAKGRVRDTVKAARGDSAAEPKRSVSAEVLADLRAKHLKK